MDAIKMLTQDEIDAGVQKLSENEAAYLKLLVSHLVRSFSDRDYSCVMVVGNNVRGTVSVCSVNAGEEHSAELLMHSCDVLGFADTVGAPPKGMFN